MLEKIALAEEAYFYPRPPRGGRLIAKKGLTRLREGISIHALREEGDDFLAADCLYQRHISIHALREEGDFLPGSYC